MRISTLVTLGLPAFTYGFPNLMGASREEMEAELKKRYEAEELEKRQGLGGLLGGLTGTIAGLLGSVASAVDPNNKRPEPGYVFKAPGPNDSRGPCPGLNLLANYGYLPRNGHVSFGQVVSAAARGFNMGVNLASLLSTFAILTDGDPVTETWYLGAGPNNVGGLNRHSTVEADISPNREDYYNGCGDNHHLSSRMFAQNVRFAADSPGKQFDLEAMGNQYAANAKFTQTNNPYVYYFPFPLIVSLGAFVFYPNFFGNGTYRAGGVANYESISSIVGAKYIKKTGNFEYVPERWPTNWYRRATPYTAELALIDIITYTYPKYPIIPGVSQSLGNLNATTVLCDVYQGLNSITPLVLARGLEDVGGAISWAASKLEPLFGGTALGCPNTAISTNYLYPNATQVGGPVNPPPGAQVRNQGDNVYNKVYFRTAPVKRKCNHSYSS